MKSQNQTVHVNGPMVVSETIDNESIILHHGTGQYFSTRGTGAVVWEGIELGLSLTALAERLQSACAIERNQADQTIIDFIDLLESRDLIKRQSISDGVTPHAPPPLMLKYEEPKLEVHDDLADMLLLDPIHDVSEAGWPSAKSTI